MADKQKKMAAALAAVNAYLQDEEALLASQSQPLAGGGPQPQLSLWGFSARQETMNMRRLIQMRAFERCR